MDYVEYEDEQKKYEVVKHCKVPLEIQDIKEYFLNKNTFFYLNYAESSVKGNMFLSYIGNLEIPCEINYAGMAKEDKFELLKEYMSSRSQIKLISLALSAGQVILHFKDVDADLFLQNPLFTKEECDEFITNNKDLVSKWVTFIASTQVFLLTLNKEIADAFNFKNTFSVIDDAHYVGHNVINLFSAPKFMELFFSAPHSDELYYFKQQFEEYMFKGKNLYHYYSQPENFMYLVMQQILSGDLTPELLSGVIAESLGDTSTENMTNG